MKKYTGTLISVEGIDGSGKSTLVHALSQKLIADGIQTIATREPGGSQLGQYLRTILHNHPFPICGKAQFLLFAADRAQHMHDVVLPALEQGNIVISDRMGHSSIAYQAYGNGLDVAMIESTNLWSMNGITPDIIVYLKIPFDVALTRINERGTKSSYEEKVDYLKRVHQAFEIIFENHPQVITIDATTTPEIVAQTAYEKIRARLRLS